MSSVDVFLQFHSQDVLIKPMPQITGGYKNMETLIYLENNAKSHENLEQTKKC